MDPTSQESTMQRALKEAPVPIEIRKAFISESSHDQLDPRIESFLTEYQAWYSGMRLKALGPEERPKIDGFMTTREWSQELPKQIKEIQKQRTSYVDHGYHCNSCNTMLPNALEGDFSCPQCHNAKKTALSLG